MTLVSFFKVAVSGWLNRMRMTAGAGMTESESLEIA